jgi:hypothetical protein
MARDLEDLVPADIVAEVDAVYGQSYDFTDARVAGQSTKMVKGKAAAVMAVSGADFEEIAQVLGFSTPRHAELAVQRALADSLDSWDRADLKRLFMGRYETLFRGALRRSQTKGYYAREAAAATALKTLVEQIKFAGLATPSEHIVHSPAESEIRLFVHHLVSRQTALLPEEVDVLDAEVISDSASG